MKKALKNQRGETIVEVLVAFLLLMLFLALFTASLRYARRASVQAQLTRDDAYNLTSQIYPAGDADKTQPHWDKTAPKTMTFTGLGASFTVKNVQLQSCQASTGDGTDSDPARTHTFTRYYKQSKSDTAEETDP